MSNQSFLFLDGHPRTSRERKLSERKARSHTARVNTHKRHGIPLQESVDLTTERAGSPSSKRSPYCPLLTPESEQPSGDDDHADASGDSETPGNSRRVATRSMSAPDGPALRRTVSPFLGAASTITFARAFSQPELEKATDYWTNVMMPNIILPKDVFSKWFSLFCEHPLIFHSMHFAIAVHHDLLSNKLSWTTCPRTLTHKALAFSELNKVVPHITSDNAELVLYALSLLAVHDVQEDQLGNDNVLLFDPPLPAANWLNLYGRMNKPVQPHANAAVALLRMVGGMENVKLPGMNFIIASHDLLQASHDLRQPLLPCIWSSEWNERSCPDEFLETTQDCAEGSGFGKYLTADIASVLQNLATIDQAMDQARHLHLEYEELRKLIDARNAAHHHVLSLPSWDELGEVVYMQISQPMYECIRLTVRLYSTAIIFPQPPLSGWHHRILNRLRVCIVERESEMSSQSSSPVFTWVLVIAGIASFGSEDGAFFEKAFRRHLELDSSLSSPAAVRETMKQFLWTDSACERGFMVFWKTLGIANRAGVDSGFKRER